MSAWIAWLVFGLGIVSYVASILSLMASRQYMDAADEYVKAGKQWWDESEMMLRDAHEVWTRIESRGEEWKP